MTTATMAVSSVGSNAGRGHDGNGGGGDVVAPSGTGRQKARRDLVPAQRSVPFPKFLYRRPSNHLVPANIYYSFQINLFFPPLAGDLPPGRHWIGGEKGGKVVLLQGIYFLA